MSAVELVFETEDVEVVEEAEEEVSLETIDALTDLTFWYGIPLDPSMASPADGQVSMYDEALNAWLPVTLDFDDIDGSLPWTRVSSTPTTLGGYGITDAASDAELGVVSAALAAHIADVANPHAVTKAQIGLGNVENTALSTWGGSTNITTVGTLAAGAVPASLVTAGTFGSGDYVFPALLTANQIVANPTLTNPAAAANAIQANPTLVFTADWSGGVRGLTSNVSLDAQTGASVTSSTGVRGLSITMAIIGAGTATAPQAFFAQIENTGPGTVTRAYGGRILQANNSGGGSVGTAVGLVIDKNTVGTSGNVQLLLGNGTAGQVPTGDWALHSLSILSSAFLGAVTIGATSAPNAAAVLDLVSTTKCLLPPRMTSTQRDAISSPPNGSVLYNSTTDKLQVRAAGAWTDLH